MFRASHAARGRFLTSCCVMVVAAVAGREVSTLIGLCRNCSVMRRISGRHRGGEKQRLAREGNQFADAFDVGNEAHIQHAVGFVDHQQFDAGEQEAATFKMIEQAAGRCDQHIDAAHQLGILIVEGDAADQQRHIELLARRRTSRNFPAPARRVRGSARGSACAACGARAAGLEHGDHRQGEGGGLAGAGLGDAEDVAPCENVREWLQTG